MGNFGCGHKGTFVPSCYGSSDCASYIVVSATYLTTSQALSTHLPPAPEGNLLSTGAYREAPVFPQVHWLEVLTQSLNQLLLECMFYADTLVQALCCTLLYNYWIQPQFYLRSLYNSLFNSVVRDKSKNPHWFLLTNTMCTILIARTVN